MNNKENNFIDVNELFKSSNFLLLVDNRGNILWTNEHFQNNYKNFLNKDFQLLPEINLNKLTQEKKS